MGRGREGGQVRFLLCFWDIPLMLCFFSTLASPSISVQDRTNVQHKEIFYPWALVSGMSQISKKSVLKTCLVQPIPLSYGHFWLARVIGTRPSLLCVVESSNPYRGPVFIVRYLLDLNKTAQRASLSVYKARLWLQETFRNGSMEFRLQTVLSSALFTWSGPTC